MKTRLLSLTFAALFALNLTACGSSSKFPETAKDKSKIMTVKSNVGTESVKYSEYRYCFLQS